MSSLEDEDFDNDRFNNNTELSMLDENKMNEVICKTRVEEEDYDSQSDDNDWITDSLK